MEALSIPYHDAHALIWAATIRLGKRAEDAHADILNCRFFSVRAQGEARSKSC